MTDDSMELFGYKCERAEEFLITFRLYGGCYYNVCLC